TAEYHLAHQLAKQAGRNRLSRILRSKTVLLTKPWRLARTNRRASRAKPHQSSTDFAPAKSTPCSPERLQSPKAVVIATAAVSMTTAATMAAAAGFQPCFLSCAGCTMDDSATMAMAKAQVLAWLTISTNCCQALLLPRAVRSTRLRTPERAMKATMNPGRRARASPVG